MALINSEDSFDDTEFVVGSDPSGMPPGMKAVEDDEVEIDIEEEVEAPKKKEAKAEPEDDIEILNGERIGMEENTKVIIKHGEDIEELVKTIRPVKIKVKKRYNLIKKYNSPLFEFKLPKEI